MHAGALVLAVGLVLNNVTHGLMARACTLYTDLCMYLCVCVCVCVCVCCVQSQRLTTWQHKHTHPRTHTHAEVRQSERSPAVARHVLAAQKDLEDAGMRKLFRQFPEIERYLAQFDSLRFRRAILVIIGGTNLGKSELV